VDVHIPHDTTDLHILIASLIIMRPTVGKGAISVAFVRPSVRRVQRIIREPKGL